MSEQPQENFINQDELKKERLRLLQGDAQEFSEDHLGRSQAGGGSTPPTAEQVRRPEPDVPGITRPEVHTEQPMITDVKDLNGSLARGVEAVEKDLEGVLSNKTDAGGPESWINMIGDLQEKSKDE